ncbi:hypothetical protein [Acinetobacter baumannii]|jgi:hypothetical protein|uniref:hypothetical protein n=1 Tax=Acinetobacter baumannii TaxID=470 RepID=UPI0002D06337|nr:hypothetical protein [Acinetobacter baumannii]EHU1524624.1 hypothetical protein [Acinetobacter baumannii]EHU1539763.1 hypothetical protein [Acinetobacter baumannii]EHU2001296.1 hypothetical protein [Acinetobacter baumannii]ENW61036.1 hypothetical protein F915_01768 [Acinetobacter baumannii NIPH 70]MBD0449041.1 hypothetical protein [Acinetobacter baumannii]
MKNNIFKILVLALFSTSPLFCYANNTIMIKGNIVEDTCSTKSNEIECNEVNNLNIKLDSEYLNKDSLYKLAQHTEKMDTSIESLGSNRKIILINYH